VQFCQLADVGQLYLGSVQWMLLANPCEQGSATIIVPTCFEGCFLGT
jgi:hypothetical protein